MTVAAGTRRVDLVLPDVVPVAELLPEVARSVGLLDAETVYGGYRLALADGRALAPEGGLVPQGVMDGAVLLISAGVAAAPRRVYDDAVEAMADAVQRDLTAWSRATGRLATRIAAGLLLLLGAATLLAQRGSPASGVVAVGVAALLAGGAIVLSRVGRHGAWGTAVSWLATAYGVVAGLLLDDRAVAGAGLGLLATGVVAVLGLGQHRPLALPAVVVGGLLLIGDVAQRALGCSPEAAASVLLVGLVLVAGCLPRIALSMRREESVGPVDLDTVATEARTAHEILLGGSASVGLGLVILAPVAVAHGLAGTVLAVIASLLVALRTRQQHSRSQVLVGLASALVGLTATGLAVLHLRADWRPVLAGVLVASGGALLALAEVPGEPAARHRRLGDAAETLCLVALLPLLAWATGLISRVPS